MNPAGAVEKSVIVILNSIVLLTREMGYLRKTNKQKPTTTTTTTVYYSIHRLCYLETNVLFKSSQSSNRAHFIQEDVLQYSILSQL